ncbi:hypothetical protein EVAR_19079_1 [Eumeta japonica]|uniref:Uncharacterized protein n=1 Tax=Eumeta variegata TaxID=151549 RepID=A0A4C1UP33_EUMVA|nr:hypothetical protein EVAR_19079_1 [Eumeta japonica]
MSPAMVHSVIGVKSGHRPSLLKPAITSVVKEGGIKTAITIARPRKELTAEPEFGSITGPWVTLSLHREPHSTDVVFPGSHRRTFLTQIVNHFSANTFELVKPVMNSIKGWSFITKDRSNFSFRGRAAEEG